MIDTTGPPRPRFRLVANLSAVLVVLALAGCSSSESAASDECRSPRLVVVVESSGDEPPTAEAGSSMTVAGEHFADGCVPVEGEPGDLEPLEPVRIFVQQGSESISVAQVSPSPEFDFDVEFGVPVSLTPGPARVVAIPGSTTEPGDDVLSSIEFEVTGP